MGKPKRPVRIDGIEFDALISSSESFSADVPDYPCEAGYSVHDTIVTKPMELSLTLFLTNNPVTWYNRFGGSSKDRVQIVEEKLRSLFAERKMMTVLTATDKYTNMCITSVGIDKSSEYGSSRGISITLKQVNVTKTQTVTVPASYGKSGTSMADAGTAGTGNANSNTQSGSSEDEKSKSKDKASLLYSASKKFGMI